jgi:hypothetical protein
MRLDTSKEGLHTLFKPYQAALLEHIWKLNNPSRTGITSGQAHEFLQETGDPEMMKSRASVIFFLNDMVDEGVLDYEEESGKGGFHRVYYSKMDRKQFAEHVTKTVTDKLHEVFQA